MKVENNSEEIRSQDECQKRKILQLHHTGR